MAVSMAPLVNSDDFRTSGGHLFRGRWISSAGFICVQLGDDRGQQIRADWWGWIRFSAGPSSPSLDAVP